MNKEKLVESIDKAFGKEELAELKDIKFRIKELIESQKQLSEASKNDVLSWIADVNISLKAIANKEYPKTEIPPFPKIPEFPEKKLDDIKKAIENIKQPIIKTEKIEFPDNLKQLNQKELSALLRELSEGDIQKLTDIVSAINRLGVRDNPIFVKVLDKKSNVIASNARGGITTSSSPPAYHTGVKDVNGNEAYLNLNAQGQLEVDANFTGTIDLGNVGLLDSTDTRINPATEDTLVSMDANLSNNGDELTLIKANTDYKIGIGVNGIVDLTNANTAYAVPATASTVNHTLILYNSTAYDIYWGFQNTNANGILLAPGGTVTLEMGANQAVYCYSATAGADVTYTYKPVS